MKIAVCPGSFDPVTRGHMDIVRRAAGCFDRVYLCAMHNERKGPGMFSPEERLAFLRAAAAPLANVEAGLWDGLLADYARERGAAAVVKGIRSPEDLAWELEQAEANRAACPGLETLLLPALPEFAEISSTLVREKLIRGENVSELVPAAVAGMLDNRKGWDTQWRR